MALIRTGALVQAINGSLGCETYVCSGGTGHVRRRGTRPPGGAISADAQRSGFQRAVNAWGALSESQRQTWRIAAARVTTTNRLGVKVAFSGRSLFLHVNLPFARIGGSFITSAPSNPTRESMQAVGFTITTSSASCTITKAIAMPGGWLEVQGGRGFGSVANKPRKWVLTALRTYTGSTTFSMASTWPAVLGYPQFEERWFTRFRCMAGGAIWSPWIYFMGLTP